MVKLLVWLRAYWKAILAVICVIVIVIVILSFVGFLWTVTIRACSELGDEIEAQGLKNVLEDVWYGEEEK